MAKAGEREGAGEDGLIARYFAPLTLGFPGAFGLKDDAAVIAPPEGSELVVTADALIAGVHFFADDSPADIAWKSLAVNVSDLAAKAAQPLAYSLALALPGNWREDWLGEFASGLGAAQSAFGIALSGGDTTVSPAGPLMVSITAFGTVPRGGMVRRGGARAGDRLYVSGTIGDAALGLRLRRGDADARGWRLDESGREKLVRRYLQPEPRLALRDALRAHASAAMDISDGLVIDCGRMCRASGVSARIDIARVPLSPPASMAVSADPAVMQRVLTGGDDYEILAAIRAGEEQAFEAAARGVGVTVCEIGETSAEGSGVTVIGKDGHAIEFARQGYDHLGG